MTERGSRRNARTSAFLRNPFAVISTALASFLVVMVLLTARVVTGADPALHANTPSAVVVSHNGRKVLRTTASGRVTVVSTGPGKEIGGSPASHGIVTRSSGGYGAGGESDG